MKFINSVAVLFEKKKSKRTYELLNLHNYIYKWSLEMCLNFKTIERDDE